MLTMMIIMLIYVAITLVLQCQHQATFKVCDTVAYVNGSSIPLKLYYAWNPLLMGQGYRGKDSYDFDNTGAVGMLFVVDGSVSITISMQNVKLPLVAVLYVSNETAVKSGAIPKLVSIGSVNLEPDNDYTITSQIYAFVEYDPKFYSEYLRGSQHILEIKECR